MSNLKKDIERKKKEVVEKLKNGEFTAVEEPPSSSHGSFWKHLFRVKNANNEYQPFVQCQLCNEILSYSISNGTSTIAYHVKNCVDKSNQLKTNKTIDKYMSKSSEVHISSADKRLITIACAKFCSFDMRPFNVVKGPGFISLCQSLIDLSYQYGTARLGTPEANLLLPDPTNVSRTTSQIADEYRENLKQILQNDLKLVRLIGVSTDYWKNSGTGENYLAINIHYCRNEQIISFMLKTLLFDQSKTGDNTRNKIFSTLSIYGIDPNVYHIIYVTDNGSNLICGFKGEVHLRCICHCINLSLHSAVDLSPKLEILFKSCQDLSTHFKRCEMNQLLPTSLKLNIDTRWNSIHDMLESISMNFHDCEDLLFKRNETCYLNDINRKLIADLVNFLSLFKVASEQLSADTSPTLHLVVPWFWKLKNSCTVKDEDHLLVAQFKRSVAKMLDEKVHLTSLHYIATFLCPITKKFPTLDSTFRQEIYNDVRKIMKTLDISPEQSSSPPRRRSKITNKSSKKKKKEVVKQNNVMEEFAGGIEDDSDDESDEIDSYLNTKLSYSENDTLLDWWNKHSLIFPQLSLLAKSLLAVPASSSTAERVFSASGRILEKRRQSLNSDIVDDVLFIRNFRNM